MVKGHLSGQDYMGTVVVCFHTFDLVSSYWSCLPTYNIIVKRWRTIASKSATNFIIVVQYTI